MNKLLTALTAAAIGLGTFAATEASAQMSSTTTTHHSERRWEHHKRSHRECNTVWRNHHKIRQCRTVWR